jgi:hypothetical protein
VHSTPNTAIHVEFFISDVADPSGFGQGQTFAGSLDATTDANGNFSFDRLQAVPAGSFVTATVSVVDQFGIDVTSAFSNALRVGVKADPNPGVTPPPAPTPTPTPTPAPARAFVVDLVAVRVSKKKVLLLVVERFTDNGEIKASFPSPFQPDKFKNITVTPVDLTGAGVFDLLIFTAVRKGRTQTIFLPA